MIIQLKEHFYLYTLTPLKYSLLIFESKTPQWKEADAACVLTDARCSVGKCAFPGRRRDYRSHGDDEVGPPEWTAHGQLQPRRSQWVTWE